MLASSVMRVAAVDLGTNSTRLLVANVADGRVEEVVRRTTITRLGEGVDRRRRLLPLPIARVRNCLADYRRELEHAGAERTLAVATSAVRDAENGEAFLGEVEWSYGFTTRLLSGDEEARMTFAGVTTGRRLPEETLVVDVGGGSTELVAGGPQGIDFHASLDLGCVRMTERFLHSHPPTEDELDDCAGHVRAVLGERLPDEVRQSVRAAVGVAGTVTSLAALDLDLVPYDPARIHGHRLTATAVGTQLLRLAALPLAERRQLPALEPERAPVIVAGAVIVQEILRHLGLAELEVSEHDLLDGVALEAARLPEPVEGAAPPGAYTCC
jgi:exopolyphosphatase/guanosine-5'-triphosphate,3'-diphosphate pyrophosphatase